MRSQPIGQPQKTIILATLYDKMKNLEMQIKPAPIPIYVNWQQIEAAKKQQQQQEKRNE